MRFWLDEHSVLPLPMRCGSSLQERSLRSLHAAAVAVARPILNRMPDQGV